MSCGCRAADASALFYALLLKDLGCSSNAAKISYLFRGDDLAVKRSIRMIDWTEAGAMFPQWLATVRPRRLGRGKAVANGRHGAVGAEGRRKISEIRCEHGAEIARMLRLPEATAAAIASLDEHWNGQGSPRGLKGEMIPLLGRICCLAQTVEVFFTAHGRQAAIDVAVERGGQWFDPQLVDALLTFKGDSLFWHRLATQNPQVELARWEPEDAVLLADEDCLDRVAEAFAKVVDAKSPWTYEHSTRVAEITVGMAKEFGCTPQVQRDLQAGRLAARHRQAGRLEPDSRQARKADGRGIRGDPQASGLLAADSHASRGFRQVGRRCRVPTTNGWTARDTTAGWRGASFPGRRGSWRWLTCARRCPRGGLTATRCPGRPFTKSCPKMPAGGSTRCASRPSTVGTTTPRWPLGSRPNCATWNACWPSCRPFLRARRQAAPIGETLRVVASLAKAPIAGIRRQLLRTAERADRSE